MARRPGRPAPPATPAASGPRPTCCRAHPEAAVGLLTGQQGPDLGALQDPGRVGGRGLAIPVAEQVPAGEVANRRLLGAQQPRQRRRAWIIAWVVHDVVMQNPASRPPYADADAAPTWAGKEQDPGSLQGPGPNYAAPRSPLRTVIFHH